MKLARIARASSAGKVLRFMGGAATFVAILSAAGRAPAEPGWTQVWNDEFDGATLDTTKWFAETTNNPANQELQAYRPSQVTVSGGNMVILAEKRTVGGKDYVSGRVHSIHEQRHGRWEVRADLPTTKGLWPAIWLLPDPNEVDSAWPSETEIDIMENRGQQPNLTSSAFHYGTNPPYDPHFQFTEQTTARFGQPVNYHTGFHTYAVEWDASKIRLFVDDVHHWTLFNAEVDDWMAAPKQVKPMWTMLNLAVGGQFLGPNGSGNPDATSVFPQQFLIDYVRISQKNNDPIKFRNGDFEANSGSMAHWSEFGNTINTNNVSVHNEAAQGNASLKLFGSFSSNDTSGASQGITVAAGDEVRAAAESFVRTADALAGSNSVIMKIEFYNQFGGRRGGSDNAFISEVFSNIATSATPKDAWRSHQLTAVAPAGAVEARLAFVFDQPGSSGGAIHIDNVSFINPRFNDPADADDDGDVDADDLGVWSQDYGTSNLAADSDGDADVDGDDFLVWQQRLTPPPSSAASTTAVPEPWGVALAAAAFMPLVRPTRSDRP